MQNTSTRSNNNKEIQGPFYNRRGSPYVKSNVLGCRTVQQCDLIRVKPSAQVNQVSEDVPVPHLLGLKLEDVQETYPDVFEGLGTLGPELHLDVDPNCPPVQLPPRKIPESLKQPLREHLDDLVKRDVIERVTEPTEWVSALVVVAKPNGKIRLCLDPRPLNKALKRCHYPIPTIDDVLPELSNAKVFTKVDCSNGYWQVKLDDESSLLTTFNTPFERFKWKRKPFNLGSFLPERSFNNVWTRQLMTWKVYGQSQTIF